MVTVVIPVKNRSGKLKQAITSVINQTFSEWELIVADDNSTEDIEALVKSFNDARIKYIRLLPGSNANTGRNKGAELASYPYIAYLDSDDAYLPFHLQQNIDKLKNSNSDFFYGGAKVEQEGKCFELPARQLGHDEFPLDYLLGGGMAQTSSYFISRKRVLEERWDESLNRHQDYDFFLRQRRLGLPACTDKISVKFYWSENRNYFFSDCIRVMEPHEKKIYAPYYAAYIKSMLRKAQLSGEKEYEKYYWKKLNQFPYYIPLNEYLQLSPQKNANYYWVSYRFMKTFFFQVKRKGGKILNKKNQ